MEENLDIVGQVDMPTHSGGGSENGRRKRRPTDKASESDLNIDIYAKEKRWKPYDPSELVVFASESLSERYPLLQKKFTSGGLDYVLLQNSPRECLETLVTDMYSRLQGLDTKVTRLTATLEKWVRENTHLQRRLDYCVDVSSSMMQGLDAICMVKNRAESMIAEFQKTPMAPPRPLSRRPQVPVAHHSDMDTLLQAAIGDISASSDESQTSSEEDEKEPDFHVHLLGRRAVSMKKSSPSTIVEMPLHALHISKPVDITTTTSTSSSDIEEGIYYFQKEFLKILNMILPKRMKVGSLGAWNYPMLNVNTRLLKAMGGDLTAETRELAKGSKGVILLTHDTVKNVLDGMEARIQDDSKWERVPDRVKKQHDLKQRVDTLVTQIKTILESFHDLMVSHQPESNVP